MGVTDISKVEAGGKVEDIVEKTKKLSPEGQKAVQMATELIIDANSDFGLEADEQVNLQPKSKSDFEQAIRTAQANVLRRKQALKNAKDMLKDEVEGLDAYAAYEDVKAELKTVKDELEAAKIESASVEHATVEVEDAVAELGSANGILSDLLVVYAGKFNTRTVEADERRLIELTAKLGKVEVEQLSLF